MYNLGPNGLSMGSSTRVQDRSTQIIIHKADQPDIVVNFFDADSLAGKDRAEIAFFQLVTNLTLEISDLGQGPSAGASGGQEERRLGVGVDIHSMQERVKLIGGRLEVDFTSHGTTVRVTIPLEKDGPCWQTPPRPPSFLTSAAITCISK